MKSPLLCMVNVVLWLGLGQPPSASPQSDSTPWKVGQALPEVHLPRIGSGEELRLSSFLGQRVLLIEFASW